MSVVVPDVSDFSEGIESVISSLAAKKEMPHIIIHGSKGSEKNAISAQILKKFFNCDLKLRANPFSFTNSSGKKIELSTFASQYHLEVNPSEAGYYDRLVIQEVISDFAKSRQVDKSGLSLKVIVIHESEKLTKAAQQSLRRTMEKYSSNIRIILLAAGLSCIIPPLKSRCLIVKCPLLSDDAVTRLVSKAYPSFVIGRKEVVESRGNLKLALLKASLKQFCPEENVDYNDKCAQIARKIASEQSVKALVEMRTPVIQLLSICMPPEEIIENILSHLIQLLPADTLGSVFQIASEIISRLDATNKALFHIEAFVAKTMSFISVAK